MKKYYLSYFVFWAPAFVVACFFNDAAPGSRVSQWIFAGIMLLGWCVNTAAAAYYFPRTMLSGLLLYLGINLLLAVALYNTGASAHRVLLMRVLGFASFTPLDIVITYMLEYNVPHEIYVICFIFLLLALSWGGGAIYGRLNPNPYRPRISGRG